MRVGVKKTLWLLCIAFALMMACFVLATTGRTVVKAADNTFEMVNGASVRFAGDDSGIRFRVKMGVDVYNDIVDNANVTLKFVISSKANFESSGGNYMGIDNKRVVDVDEAKIYQDGDYYYANGCLTQIRTNNREVDLVAIAVKVTDGSAYGYAAIDGVGATGKMYDILNQALLATSNDYIPSITGTSAFSWYGSADYPVYINTDAAYEVLADKFETVSATALQGLKYNIVDEVNGDAIDNDTFKGNVTTTYKVTFDPNNGDASTSAIYKSGDAIITPADPEKAGNETYTYFFNGWGAEVPATCSASATYTAVYTQNFRNYTVTFKSHDGSVTISTKANYHYGDTVTVPKNGTAYTVGSDNFNVTGVQGDYSATVSGNAEYRVKGTFVAPAGKLQGYLRTIGDGGAYVAATNSHITLTGHTQLGGITEINGETGVMYRSQGATGDLDLSSNAAIAFTAGINNIVTEMYLPFYVDSLTGTLAMNLHTYNNTYSPTIDVTFKNAAGATVTREQMTAGNWYTAIYDLSSVVSDYKQRFNLVIVANDGASSAVLYYRAPYYTVAGGLTVEQAATAIANVDGSQRASLRGIESAVVSNVLDVTGTLASVGTSSHQWNERLSFSNSVFDECITAWSAGNKMLRMNIKFGTSVNLVGYYIVNKSPWYVDFGTSFVSNQTYFRFYTLGGDVIAYSNLAVDTWYTLDIDLDEFKAIDAFYCDYSGGNSTILLSRTEAGTISVKNAEIIENYAGQIPLKGGHCGAMVSYYFESDGTVVAVGTANGATSGLDSPYAYWTANPFLDWSSVINAQAAEAYAAGGKVMRFNIRFDQAVALAGCYYTDGGNWFNTISDRRMKESTDYIRYYNLGGTQITYADLVAGTWYTMEIDLDAFKNGASNYNTGGMWIRFANLGDSGTISVKNVVFADKA